MGRWSLRNSTAPRGRIAQRRHCGGIGSWKEVNPPKMAHSHSLKRHFLDQDESSTLTLSTRMRLSFKQETHFSANLSSNLRSNLTSFILRRFGDMFRMFVPFLVPFFQNVLATSHVWVRRCSPAKLWITSWTLPVVPWATPS